MKYFSIFILTMFPLLFAHAEIENLLSTIDSHGELYSIENSCPAALYNDPEKNYKNYIAICATGPTSCLSKCLKGSSNHCFGLANNLQAEEVDKKYAEKLYALACKQGLVTACTNRAAGMMRFSPERKKCYAQSFKLTCSKSDAWGCTMYALVLSRGIGIEKNRDLALAALKTGCKHGIEDEACRYAKELEREILSGSPSR